MTTDQIRQWLNLVLNKDSSGNSLSPDELNLLFAAQIYPFVKDQILQYRSYVLTGSPMDDTIFTSFLVDALQTSTTLAASSGSFTIPSDCLFISDIWITYNSTVKKAEPVSAEEYSKRVHNMLSKPLAYYPVYFIEGTTCKIRPYPTDNASVSYIKKPAIPVFDYYNDANDNIVYLAAGANRTLSAGETGSAGQTSGTVSSLTVELDIPQELHMKFCEFLLSKVAIRNKDQFMYQTNENEVSKT